MQANCTLDARIHHAIADPVLRSWTTEDDEDQVEEQLMRMQQLESDASTCRSNLSELQKLVDQDQSDIDEAERQFREARTNTEACVELLAQRRKHAQSSSGCKWILPIAGGVALGAAVPVCAPLATMIIAKASIASAGAAASKLGQSTACKLDQSRLRRDEELVDKMHSGVSEINLSLTSEERLEVISAGDDVCARFLKAVHGNWRRVYFSRRAILNELTMYKSTSCCRTNGTFVNGHAYMIEFQVAVAPSLVFHDVLRKKACISIDPSCTFSWDVPVEDEHIFSFDPFVHVAQSTSLRSILLPRAFFSRNLLLVSRACQDTTVEGVERYILASGSPLSDQIPKEFQRIASTGCEAHCRFMGVLVESIGIDRSRVRLAIDADPRVPVGGNRQADLVVRTRLIEMARRLRSGLGAPVETPLNSLIA
jgi:hypothetical protein